MDASPSEQPTSRRRGGMKRKSASINTSGSSSNPTTSWKRQAREKPQAAPFPPIHVNGPCTRARVQLHSSDSLSEVALVKREAEAREAAARAEEMSRASENWEALEAKIEAEYEAIRSRDASVHVVPIHAEAAIADELVKSEGPSVEYHCNSCSADCSRKRYHCQKQVL